MAYLGAARPADWEFRVNQSNKIAMSELTLLKTAVLGKTGNDEAEDKLFSLWGDILQKTFNMSRNKPGVLAQLKDRASIFLTDFWKGAQEGQQAYASWAIEKAGPLLKIYHGALQKLFLFKKDLAEAKAAGRPAAEIAQQEAKIANAEGWANKIRSTFSAISAGASIDKLATDKYGALGFTWQAVGAAVSLAILSGLIMGLVEATLEISPLVGQAKLLIEKLDRQITETAKGANIALTTAKEKVELLVPVIIGSLALIAGGAFYYFVIRKRSKTE
jgi:hypothetical protein